jgi:hypothetical protein
LIDDKVHLKVEEKMKVVKEHFEEQIQKLKSE